LNEAHYKKEVLNMNKSDRNDMNSYFYFNDSEKEVCLKRHDTPMPWINYLSNGTFHTMISQAGGGVAFYKSPQIWRISRYRFFHLPTDRSGPYIYIKDAENGEYWCPTYEPVQTRPEKWESRHGMGYTCFNAERNGVSADLVYFVGKYENSLIWNLKLKNNSAKIKNFSIFAYVEFGMMEFMRELQWQCYNKHQLSVSYMKESGALLYKYGVEMQPKPDETPLVYFAADRIPDAYDGDRDEFIGSYRSESNPYAIEHDGCSNSTIAGGDPCGALQFNITIEPGRTEEINIFLGTGMTQDDIEKSIENSRKPEFVAKSLSALKGEWKTYLDKFVSTLPDKDAERMINIWNPYQAQRNFQFSRNISFYATGTFRGVGYRDTSQDILALIPFDLEQAKEKTRMLLREQYNDGHVNHYFFPNEGWDPVKTIHSDDHLWTILTVWNIVVESGDTSFLDEKISYYDGGDGTVYEHLKKSIEFTRANLGPNGFPLMLRSDWNDQLFRVCKKGKGESIWTAMQLGLVLLKMIQLSNLTGEKSDAAAYEELYARQKELVNSVGWDGKWFRRAVMDDGRFLGSDVHDQAKIWLNAQTWSIMSGMGDEEKSITAMDSVKEMLDTDLGIKKIHPSITTFPDPKEPLTNYNPGTGENGAVFCHANTWGIIAEAMLGRGDLAYKYYRQLIPNVAMERAGAWRYKAEPYVYSSNLFGPESDKFGLANVSWLTGTAAWMYIAATQYILGVRADWEGLMIDPCIPSDWKEVKVVRVFRGCTYNITIRNDNGVCKGVKALEVDGQVIKGNIIPFVEGKNEVTAIVQMG
jgi:cellobiose phosphorylase